MYLGSSPASYKMGSMQEIHRAPAPHSDMHGIWSASHAMIAPLGNRANAGHNHINRKYDRVPCIVLQAVHSEVARQFSGWAPRGLGHCLALFSESELQVRDPGQESRAL